MVLCIWGCLLRGASWFELGLQDGDGAEKSRPRGVVMLISGQTGPVHGITSSGARGTIQRAPSNASLMVPAAPAF